MRKAKTPICHPERKHCAKGLCYECYGHAYARRIRGIARCHPDRKHYAKNLCRQCWEAYQKKRREDPNSVKALCHPEEPHYAHGRCAKCWFKAQYNRTKHHRRHLWLKRTYNISIEEYERILALQDGKCAICKSLPGETALHVDHDHGCCPGEKTCGRCIRGLLCLPCNRAIGWLRDSPELCDVAAIYLRSYSEAE